MIQFKNVTYQIDDQVILSNLNFTIPPQKITALIGPSGAGKSTLLKLISTLISPTSGHILIDERSIHDINIIEHRKSIGFALQSAPMIYGSVFDNLNLPKKLFQQTLSDLEAHQLLDSVQLNDLKLTQDVSKLSGGQRQRLSIARTLVNRPSILLLDEITSSLDVKNVQTIEKLVRDIQQKYKLTVIWITHDVHQASRMSDEFIMLKEGSFITQGDSNTLFQSTNHTLQQFLEDVQ